MNPQPLIAVQDVQSSSLWYQQLLGCQGSHGGANYERLTCNGQLILQLHRWDAHDHPHMGDAGSKPYGNGVVLWFQTEAFDAAMQRARALAVEILEKPHVNENANHRECWMRDPDGYVVVIASAYGDLG